MKHQTGLWHNGAHGYRLITVYLDCPMSVKTIVAVQSARIRLREQTMMATWEYTKVFVFMAVAQAAGIGIVINAVKVWHLLA